MRPASILCIRYEAAGLKTSLLLDVSCALIKSDAVKMSLYNAILSANIEGLFKKTFGLSDFKKISCIVMSLC